MESKTIEELFQSNNKSIDFDGLSSFFNDKLNDLYMKEKGTNLLDFDEIRYSAMIDLIYEIMPSLRDEISLNDK